MALKKLLLVLCVIGFAGCESREDKYIRLQKEQVVKQQEYNRVMSQLEAVNRARDYVPKLWLSPDEESVISGSGLIEQVETQGKNNDSIPVDEIQSKVDRLVDEWTGGIGLTEFELDNLKGSILKDLISYHKSLLKYHYSDSRELFTQEKSRLEAVA
ncbi:hypothetical protein N9D38_08245, partial [Rubripirellula sp.]|nr:hypothetical protein [Rubripirellula sp.]